MGNCCKQTFEIVNPEDRCTRFRRSALKLGAVYLDKPIAIQVGTEQIPDDMLKLENRMIGHCLCACQNGRK